MCVFLGNFCGNMIQMLYLCTNTTLIEITKPISINNAETFNTNNRLGYIHISGVCRECRGYSIHIRAYIYIWYVHSPYRSCGGVYPLVQG